MELLGFIRRGIMWAYPLGNLFLFQHSMEGLEPNNAGNKSDYGVPYFSLGV